MTLIIGLGNPGKKYTRTRHNLGFRVLDEFRKTMLFAGFKLSKKFNSLLSEGEAACRKIILAKPQTFMNNSGEAVKNLIIDNQLLITNLIVVHDDLDLALGKIRICQARGSAGHKGVKSIIRELGTKDFTRFRIGIQPKKGKPNNAEKFVLQKFTEEEEKSVKQVVKKTCHALKVALEEGIKKAMSEFNK